MFRLLYKIQALANLRSNEYDGIILVAEKISVLQGIAGFIKASLQKAKEVICFVG